MNKQKAALKRSGVILIVIGAFFALAALEVFHPLAHIFLQIAYWPMQTLPNDLLVPVPLLIAISGGLTAGLGAMMWALGKYVSPLSPLAAKKVTQVAALSWFCTDSVASVLVGAPFNAVLNLLFLAIMLSACRFKSELQTSEA